MEEEAAGANAAEEGEAEEAAAEAEAAEVEREEEEEEEAAAAAEVDKPPPNSVFGIAMCCLDAAYEGQSDDMLPAAFDAFPGRDFGTSIPRPLAFT